jgi:hypothetical protein
MADSRGQVNYDGYCASTGGVSLISGATLPVWADLDPRIQAAWDQGAMMVEMRFAEQFRALSESLWVALEPMIVSAWSALKGIVKE